MKKIFASLILFLILMVAHGQQGKIDSLYALLKKDKEDTNKVNHLLLLGWELSCRSNPDTAILLGNQAKDLSSAIKWSKGIAKSFGNLGLYYDKKNDYKKALDNYLQALTIDKKIGNNNGITRHLSNLGNLYRKQGDYSSALDYYFKAMKIAEKFKYQKQQATNLGNIGLVYSDQGNYDKALDYYFKSLEMKKKLGDEKGSANTLGNIGMTYHDLGNYPKALVFYFKALKMDEKLGNKIATAAALSNIGIVYYDQGESEKSKIKSDTLYNKAVDFYFKALEIDKELGNKNGIAKRLGNIGSLYISTGKFKEAEEYLKKAIAIDSSIGELNDLRQFEEILSQLYDTTGRYKLALVHYKKAMTLKDTIFSQEEKKQLVQKEMNYEFEKKEASTKAEHDKQLAVAEAEKKKQRIVIWSVALGLLLVALFAGFVFRSLRITRQQKQIIEVQKTEVEKQKLQVEKQKNIIEEKNKDITDSITYAKRIQQAKLPKKEEIYSALPNCFVLFKPKDIVSGDFYFYSPLERGKGCVIAAADCTGHGVPGAFMSMIGSEKLNDVVSQSADTSEILSLLNKGIKASLRQSESNESTRDGMDIALVSVAFGDLSLENSFSLLSPDSRLATKIKYAGANRPLWIIRKTPISSPNGGGQEGAVGIEEIKATKKAIGGFTEDNQHFVSHEIKLQQGDTFYIFSDGYADTFGGQEQKKLTTKKFKEILLSIQDKSMEEQEKHLDNFIESWKGGTEQIDDILVIGVRV